MIIDDGVWAEDFDVFLIARNMKIYIIAMSLLIPFIAALAWFANTPVPPQVTHPVQTAVTADNPARQLVEPAPQFACLEEKELLPRIAESSVVIQPYLLTRSNNASEMEQAWQKFYQQLPAELTTTVKPARILKIDETDLIAGEAFADRLYVQNLKQKFGEADNVMPVVYTDFAFGNVLRKENGVYLRQHHEFLNTNAVRERQFLTWLAYVNI